MAVVRATSAEIHSRSKMPKANQSTTIGTSANTDATKAWPRVAAKSTTIVAQPSKNTPRTSSRANGRRGSLSTSKTVCRAAAKPIPTRQMIAAVSRHLRSRTTGICSHHTATRRAHATATMATSKMAATEASRMNVVVMTPPLGDTTVDSSGRNALNAVILRSA